MPWTEKLEQCEYMVQLKCVAMYQDMYMMTEARSSPIQPTQDPRHCHSCVRGQNISLVLPRHLPVCPGYHHGQAGPGLHQPDPLFSHAFPGQLCAAKFTADGGMYRARVIKMGEQAVSIIYIDYGDMEMKDKADLGMLSDEMLIMPPAVVKVANGWWGGGGPQDGGGRWDNNSWSTLNRQVSSQRFFQ